MKKIIVILSACLLISLMGYSQKITPDKVPVPVKQAFAKKFPAATDVKYEMEKKDYEINFKDKGVEMSANFDAMGNWLETETEIKPADLPKEISSLHCFGSSGNGLHCTIRHHGLGRYSF